MSSSWIKLHLRPASCLLVTSPPTGLFPARHSVVVSELQRFFFNFRSPKKTLSPVKCGVTSDKPDSEGPPLSGGRVGENAGHNRQSSLREPGWRQRRNRRAGRSNATLLFWLSPHHTGLCAGVRHTPAS